MKVCETIPKGKCSQIPKISKKRTCTKVKVNQEAEALLQKENIENADLPKLRHRRKGLMSPLKPIQVESVSNKSPLNVDENLVVTKNVDNITDSCNKNSAEKNDSNFHQVGLFESPEKKNLAIEKSPIKKVRENLFTEDFASSLAKDVHFIKVLKPVKCYQSPHQSNKLKSRTKAASGDHRMTKHDKEAVHQSKKHVSKAKKVPGEKQKAREENEEAENVSKIEILNQHFSELEKMDLCIE